MDFTGKGPCQEMVIYINFFGTQQVITKTDSITMPVKKETRVHDALEYLRQKYPALNLDDGIMITVNQEIASPDRILMTNDTVSFLPFISGG
jgi:molybdopterin converting factor small subunit